MPNVDHAQCPRYLGCSTVGSSTCIWDISGGALIGLIAVSVHVWWKYAQNSLTVLSNRHNFSPFVRNRGRWTRWWGPFLDRKQNSRYFCACALKKSSKYSENVFRQKSYSLVTGNRGRRSEWRGQIFDRRLINRRFCACAVKNRPKTCLLCCQIAKILASL